MNKKHNINESSLDFIKKNKKLFISILLVATILIILLPLITCSKLPMISENSSRLDIVESVSQIVAVIFVCISACIAVFQYYISSQSEIIKIETDKVERAIKLAEYYKNQVLEPYMVVSSIYEKAGIFEKMQSKRKNMVNFDVEELNEVFTKKEIQELKEMYVSDEFLLAMGQTNDMLNLNLQGCNIKRTEDQGIRKVNCSIDPVKALNDFKLNYVSTLLNNMEYFAMYFTHNIADESVVYQSLYPTYIDMCRTLYYDISIVSDIGAPKLYRNLIELYTIWLERVNETQCNIQNQQNKKGTTLSNIRNEH